MEVSGGENAEGVQVLRGETDRHTVAGIVNSENQRRSGIRRFRLRFSAQNTLIHEGPSQTHTPPHSPTSHPPHTHTGIHTKHSTQSGAMPLQIFFSTFFFLPLSFPSYMRLFLWQQAPVFWHTRVETCRKCERPPGSWQQDAWRTGVCGRGEEEEEACQSVGVSGATMAAGVKATSRRSLALKSFPGASVCCSVAILSYVHTLLWGSTPTPLIPPPTSSPQP